MCGIAGIFDPAGERAPDELASTAGRMADAQAHRGPDGRGVWADPDGCLALGHRRLAVLDLTEAGAQPMQSACGRFVLCFNGEIYNHVELRAQVDAARAYSGRPALSWRGRSDTETLLEAFVLWPARDTLRRVVGPFALGLWDRRDKVLLLARDRFGEKPLHYAVRRRRLLFASELPGLARAFEFTPAVDRSALALYLRLCCIPAPHCILKGVRKLPPGCCIGLRAGDLATLPEPEPYWSLKSVAETGLAAPFQGGEHEALDALHELLRQSVRGQMLADVPVGALLSGGVDSSLVTAIMAEESARLGCGPVRTFSIGYRGEGAAYDESAPAEAMAKRLGTRHATHIFEAEEALDLAPRLASIAGEPFADASLLPTALLAARTRREVTVCLTGDGGDELFAGYNRHVSGAALWAQLSGVAPGLRSAAAELITALSPRAWDRVFRVLGPVLPQSLRQRLPGEKLHKLAQALPARVAPSFYAALVSAWPDPGMLVSGAAEAGWALRQRSTWPAAALCPEGGLAWMQFLDAAWYLPGDILTKVDRAAMRVGLEARAPYLDHRVAAFAWGLPPAMRVRAGKGKWALRMLLDRYVPHELWDRPKMGFGAPLDVWLRGPLKSWAESLLDPERLACEGYIEPGPVARAWAEHQSGRFNRQYRLWPVLMFQSWLESAGISG
jgi:asparagine synthase (glutamine-hydrolysing)